MEQCAVDGIELSHQALFLGSIPIMANFCRNGFAFGGQPHDPRRATNGHQQLDGDIYRDEGVPGKEAAEVLGIREGTLWRRLHEARV